MKKINLFVAILYLLFLISCHNQKQNKVYIEKSVSFDLSKTHEIKDLFSNISDVDIIPLETSDSCIISEVSKIKCKNDDIFVLDNKQRILFCFDNVGKYKFKIDKVGRGPGEYIEIFDFDIYNDQIYLLDIGKILIYDSTGIFKQKISVDDNCLSLSVMENNLIALVSASKEDSTLIKLKNKQGETVGKLLPCTHNMMELLGQRSSSEFNFWKFDNLYLSMPFSNCIYKITSKDRIKSVISFDYNFDPSSFIEENIKILSFDDFWENLEDNYFSSYKKLYSSSNILCLGELKNTPILLLYNQKSGLSSVYNSNNFIYVLFDNSFCTDKDGCFISYVEASMIKDLHEYIKTENESLMLQLEKTVKDNEQNPILIKYVLKP